MKVKSFILKKILQLIQWFFTVRCRRRLCNRKFSILCSNCIGGIIYHRLGLQFNSPTVNLWIRQYDFIKLIMNPTEYLNKELVFVDSEYPHPVAMLGDIRIHFNHSRDEEEARNDWERRKKRIEWDNLYIIMYDRDNLSREQILSLKQVKCKRLIVLSERNIYSYIDYVYHIDRPNKGRDSEHVFLDTDFFGLRTFEKQWDFVKWLNGQRR